MVFASNSVVHDGTLPFISDLTTDQRPMNHDFSKLISGTLFSIIVFLLSLGMLSCGARDEPQTVFEPKVIDRTILKDTGFACLMTTDKKMTAGLPITAAVVLDQCYGCATEFTESECNFRMESNRLVLSAVTTKTRYTSEASCSFFCNLFIVQCVGPKVHAGQYEVSYAGSVSNFSIPATSYVSVPHQDERCIRFFKF